MPTKIMAPRGRRRPSGVHRPDDDTTGQLAAPHEGIPEEELSDDVEHVLAQLGENASSVIVARMKDGKPGEWAHITRIPAPEFNVETIKEQFGGGEYRITILDRVQGPLNSVYLSIDPRFVGKYWQTAQPVLPNPAQPPDPFKDQLLQVLLAKALTPPPPPPPSNDMALVLQVAEIFTRKDSSGGNVMEQVAAMLNMATTLAQTMNPPEGLAGVAAQFLPVVERLVPSPRSGAVPVPRRIPAAAAAAATPSLSINPAAAAAAAPAVPPSNVPANGARVAGSIAPQWLAPFKGFAGMLVTLADVDSDPSLYADVAIERFQLDATLFTAAIDAMNAGTLLTDLFAIAPALQATEKRKAFAAELVAKIEEGLRELSAPDEDDTTAEDAGGDETVDALRADNNG